MAKIESVKNERIKHYAKLKEKKHRDAMAMFLVEGEHLIQEALAHGLVEVLLYSKEHSFDFEGERIEVSQPVLDKLSFSVSKADFVAVCRVPETKNTQRSRVILLDGVQDPGNVGTIVRCAVAFGFDQVILSPECADMYNEKVIRATQGAMFQLPTLRTDIALAIDALKQEGFVVYGTGFTNASALSNIKAEGKMAFVMGNEGNGVRPHILDACDGLVMIEMGDFDSLNVAVASGILMYTFRQLGETK